ncbi:hypothetical protein Pyn_08352 [Prunus yedoensis var. nudiflora]|uniref:Uncharacterized protein n=1 Tax=Prunus yedoensis var. nudiflora TaxID=2094558 RepID=A0A314Z2J3_PRUYE|nr:hypothetical protein Pyn_08352 [Prunus yedoensis var. nudiflora]
MGGWGRQSHLVGWYPDDLHLAFKGTWARFVRCARSAVEEGLVIDVVGLYPFDLPRIAQRLRPRKDNSFNPVRRTRPTCRVFIGQMSLVCAEHQQID